MTLALLDPKALEGFDPVAFQNRRPFPWCAGPVLRPEAWQRLLEVMPGQDQFQPIFGKRRRFGQQSHDRFALEYDTALEVHPLWHELVEELESPIYHEFLAERFRRKRFQLRYHWHFTPRGRSVSPHCDARKKLGSHLFYFNDPERWQPSWGGETWILQDHGRHARRSNPDFDDFDSAESSPAIGNESLLFARRGNSWHGVRPLECPEDEFRRVFIVVIEAPEGLRRWLP